MKHDLSRGGFQNRDVGRTNLNYDFGPEYGIDYAHFSDPIGNVQNMGREGFTMADDEILRTLQEMFKDTPGISFEVKNKFAILKGEVRSFEQRLNLEQRIRDVPGVYSVINLLKVSS